MQPLPDSWIAALQVRADRPPALPRERLYGAGPIETESPARVGSRGRAQGQGVAIGSIEPGLAARFAGAALPLRRHGAGWCVDGPLDAGLERIARWLHAQGLCSRWRGELLDVVAENSAVVGRVERAAARALGLTTRAVHLVGRTASGGTWVQQRAFDKATDPALWDTLMGGLVAAGESIADTLARETREEAGLAIGDLQGLAPCGGLTIRRPVVDGYMVEHIEIFEAVVPDNLEPVNQDGEVERFECLAPDALLARLRAGAFTLEAALILLQRRPARPGEARIDTQS